MPQHDLSLGRHFADQPAADHPRCRISSGLGRVQTRRSWVGPTGNDLSSRVRMGSEARVGVIPGKTRAPSPFNWLKAAKVLVIRCFNDRHEDK